MSKRIKAIIRYDGPALANHEMDVHDLAPSLLALGELCRDANNLLNGDAASVRVLVKADTEQKCFQLGFELVQTLYDQLTDLLGQDGIQNAKNILEWIGIIGAATGATGGTLFALVKWQAKHIKSGITYNINIGENSVMYLASDGSSMEVPREVHKIAQGANSLKNVQKILLPVTTKGYEKIEFEHKEKVVEKFDTETSEEVLDLPVNWIALEENDTEHVSEIRTGVRIKKAVYEGDGMWTIIYHKAVEAKMSDEDWKASFQSGSAKAPPRSILDVDLVVTVPVDSDGIANGAPRHEITKVHGVKLPTTQATIFDTEE